MWRCLFVCFLGVYVLCLLCVVVNACGLCCRLLFVVGLLMCVLFGVVVLLIWLWCLLVIVTAAAGDVRLLLFVFLWIAFVCECVSLVWGELFWCVFVVCACCC